MNHLKKPELLAPAGDIQKLHMAILYGADAVYLAGKQFGMRAFAGNFTPDQMKEGVSFAHQHGARVYVTVNIFADNEDFLHLPDYIKELADLEVDGVLVADPGVLTVVRQVAPSLPCHLSTQANTTNWQSARFWQEAGFRRIVLARELTLSQITEIRAKVDAQLEVFVHGAMCWAYSGRCYLSQYLEGRSASRGECAQACRWNYQLMEEKHPGEYMPIQEDERGIYILNARDLCLLDYLPQLITAGVNSLKIEGRMKSENYVATVTRIYRHAIDTFINDPENYQPNPAWHEELAKISHRPYSTGFITGNPGLTGQAIHTSAQETTHEFIGIVQSYEPGRAVVEMRNRFAQGETVEITGPTSQTRTLTISNLLDSAGLPINEAIRVQEHVSFDVPFPVEPHSLVRRKK
jgi:U32 family peptidase